MARSGRPREFDREEAIFNAMLLFWEQGFESTSLSQLLGVMGNISATNCPPENVHVKDMLKNIADSPESG